MKHDQHPFRVSGVLAATGTPVDRGVYVSLEGLEAIHIGWEAGVPAPGRTLSADAARIRELTPDTITAALAGIKRQILTFQVQRDINQYAGEPLSAILPGVALAQLWQVLGQFELLLMGITAFVVVISLTGLVTVLLTLQTHRHQEIAVLRANGASPSLIASLYLLECTGLAVTATVLATGLWYLVLLAVTPWLLDTFGLAINLRHSPGWRACSCSRYPWLDWWSVPYRPSRPGASATGRPVGRQNNFAGEYRRPGWDASHTKMTDWQIDPFR